MAKTLGQGQTRRMPNFNNTTALFLLRTDTGTDTDLELALTLSLPDLNRMTELRSINDVRSNDLYSIDRVGVGIGLQMADLV
jgi:hypothetical protein